MILKWLTSGSEEDARGSGREPRNTEVWAYYYPRLLCLVPNFSVTLCHPDHLLDVQALIVVCFINYEITQGAPQVVLCLGFLLHLLLHQEFLRSPLPLVLLMPFLQCQAFLAF